MDDEPEVDLIEEARAAGKAYIDSFGGDLAAVCADLNRRTLASGRPVYHGKPKPPFDWQICKVEMDRAAAKED